MRSKDPQKVSHESGDLAQHKVKTETGKKVENAYLELISTEFGNYLRERI